ncbi:hypothetical protein PF005_g6783 [Phytophthora fragariae]|nr:hypothetical protein PF003_g28111 [Phytophthora fragariae]KAE8942894.1 hypothetical protein PF009_g7358 [Phytophthora fragariae]KAE9018631.1 hypothetical protein PF011_g6188 [Phytophthora fragariae]KAE9124602.1 hypothetical protein PF007_g6643 [Phytophthora fragariae]KAE9130668.1 hypothetical protein PF010_g3774 [Phytophthora fragariae]
MLRAGRGDGASTKAVDVDVGEATVVLSISDKERPPDTKRSAPTSAKVLFLDGIRGLAAMLVVLQHSTEYMNGVNVGATAVDAFFVLSSFLLTMLFLRKAETLLAQGASYRKWAFALVDYFLKRFFRVYPFFALVAVLLWRLPFEYQNRFFLVENADKYDLFKVLTFDFDHRYLMLWTLPLEIAYYLFIPVFVVGMARLRGYWWVGFIPLQAWVLYDGFYVFRSHHILLRPHFTTFLQGSLAAVAFVRFSSWCKASGFEFRTWHAVGVRATEYVIILLLISECFRSLLCEWVHQFVPVSPGDPFISTLLASVIVIEMVMPSAVSTTLEWNVLRHWGKISFSVYLLHPFVIFSETISKKTNYFDRLFERLILLQVLATTSFYLVELPLQRAVQQLSRALAQLETKDFGALVYAVTHTTKKQRFQRSFIA